MSWCPIGCQIMLKNANCTKQRHKIQLKKKSHTWRLNSMVPLSLFPLKWVLSCSFGLWLKRIVNTQWQHNEDNSERIQFLEYISNSSIATVCNCFLHVNNSCRIISLLVAPLVVFASLLPRGRPRSHWLVRHWINTLPVAFWSAPFWKYVSQKFTQWPSVKRFGSLLFLRWRPLSRRRQTGFLRASRCRSLTCHI